MLLGNYSGVSGDLATILEGVVGKAGPTTMVSYRQGSLLDRDNVNPIDWYSGVANDADVTVAVMGINNLLEGEEGAAIASPGKGDRFDLGLPENQLVFLRKMRENAEKLVVVLLGGSPMTISEVHELADAVLLRVVPGRGGRARGRGRPLRRRGARRAACRSPSPGRWTSSALRGLLDGRPDLPLHDRGAPLSLRLRPRLHDLRLRLSRAVAGDRHPRTAAAGTVTARVEVSNRGETAGDEVVQLYVSDQEASAAAPLAALKAFDRVSVAPGKSETVEFTVTPDMLSIVDDDGKAVVAKGRYRLTVGGASPGPRAVALGAPEPAEGVVTVR